MTYSTIRGFNTAKGKHASELIRSIRVVKIGTPGASEREIPKQAKRFQQERKRETEEYQGRKKAVLKIFGGKKSVVTESGKRKRESYLDVLERIAGTMQEQQKFIDQQKKEMAKLRREITKLQKNAPVKVKQAAKKAAKKATPKKAAKKVAIKTTKAKGKKK